MRFTRAVMKDICLSKHLSYLQVLQLLMSSEIMHLCLKKKTVIDIVSRFFFSVTNHFLSPLYSRYGIIICGYAVIGCDLHISVDFISSCHLQPFVREF